LKIYTISDIHIDYKENRTWMHRLSKKDFQEDTLILAGDISGKTNLLVEAFEILRERFQKVLYIPGNHDLWVQDKDDQNSLDFFQFIKKIAGNYDICMEPAHFGPVSIVPLFGWYDYSFGQPSNALLNAWADYVACRWPDDFHATEITDYFTSINEDFLHIKNEFVISFSHFMPRIDLMPGYIPTDKKMLYPVFGSNRIEKQIRKLEPDIHIYGHSHFNREVTKEGIKYINNAFGYPHETRITAKKLICVYASEGA
jgi:Icc-related predicted phosphoesterase